MSGGNNSVGRKRTRLFGPDPLPNVVFSLDTNRQALPLHLFSKQARISPIAPVHERAATAVATPREDLVVASSGDASAQHPPRLAPGVQLYPEATAVRSARDVNQQETGVAVEGFEGTTQCHNTPVTAVRQPSRPSPATPGTQPSLAFGRALSNHANATSTSCGSHLLQGGGDESLSLKSARPKTTLEAEAAAAAAAAAQHASAAAALQARSSEKDISAAHPVKEKAATSKGNLVTAAATVAIAAPAQKPGDIPLPHVRTGTISSTISRAEPMGYGYRGIAHSADLAGERATTHRAGGSKDSTETSVPVGNLLPGAAAGNATRLRTVNAGCAHEVADAAAGKGRAEDTALSPPRQAGSAAVSMVASFLKRGTPAPAQAPTLAQQVAGSPAPTPKNPQGLSSSPVLAWPTSSPATPIPTPLASLVTGVPPGSGRSTPGSVRGAGPDERRRWHRDPNGIGAGALPNAKGGVGGEGARAVADGVRSPHRIAGGSRFFNDEWAPRLKERRRIVRFPKRSEPAGTRVLYWVRGNYRVRDNLALSAAMWLSTKLRMPLQAVTFVDPAIGRAAPTRSLFGESARGEDGTPGAEQQLPFRTAVEASALCEMEEALRALNIPLVAVACAASEVPATFARWCSASRGCRGEKASSSSPAASPTSAAAAAAAAASPGSPIEGGVHVAIADESYHPQQLLMMERTKEVLRGVALYTVDSSCVCPVNTYRGGRVAVTGQVTAAAAATDPSDFPSREDFRQAQEELLPTVRTELMPRPRLPLEAQLQDPVLADKERGVIPGGYEDDVRPAISSLVVVDWGALREVSTRRFPGFGKPVGRNAASSTQDLIALLGGGERVGEVALQQTLDMATGAPSGQPGTAGPVPVSNSDERAPKQTCAQLESEVAGLGFGGSLLHLLRLGSLSSLYIVQRSPRDLVEAVLRREYALQRSFSFYQWKRRRRAAVTPASTRGTSLTGQCVWRATDWKEIVPAWVWEELKRGQRDTRQHQHSPGEIRSAGSTLPSSVHDGLFSAIQARLANQGRLHPTLTPYWARAVVKMMLIPSQAISLIVDLVEELCIGASHAGDVVPDLFACAFDAFKDTPDSATPKDTPDSATFKDLPDSGTFKGIPGSVTSRGIPVLDTTPSRTGAAGLAAVGSATGGTDNASANAPRGDRVQVRKIPVFGRLTDTPLASVEGLQSALGGVDALARFMLPELQPVPPSAGKEKHSTR